MPFAPRENRPSEFSDPEMVLAADKGPHYTDRFEPTFRGRRGEPLMPEDPDRLWRRYNSPNHRGRGQNCLFADGSVAFADRPTAGVQGDNIYALMSDEWDGTFFNLIHGYSPHFSPFLYPYPGQGALSLESGVSTSTDSLIYP